MNAFNFNLPMLVVFVLAGLAIGLSLQFLTSMGAIEGVDDIEKPNEIETPSPSSPNKVASDSSDEEIIITPIASESIAPKTSSGSDTNTEIILDDNETMNNTTITNGPAIATIEPSTVLTSNNNAIELIQTIIVNDNNNDQSNDNIPLSCSLSLDGSRFAVSGIMNNEVYIYDYSSTYELHVKSSKIIPSNNDEVMFGSVLSMSGDGNTLAIGSRYTNNESSIVQLYSYNIQSSEWGQVGNTLSSDAILLYDATYISLSLSQSGQYLVIGNTNSSASGPYKGQVEFYKYSKVTNAWRVDDTPPIYGDYTYGTGESISLYTYNNTLVLAVASPYSGINYTGSVSVYEYNDLYSNWRLLGDNSDVFIGNQTNSYNGISLSLSANPYTHSLMVAIGSKYYHTTDDKVSIQDQFKLYEYVKNNDEQNEEKNSRIRGSSASTSSKWIQYGKNIYNTNTNQTHNQINSLSLNGHCIAISSPFHSTQEYNNIGYVTIQCYDVTKQQFIQLDNQELMGEDENDFFGYHVHLSNIVNGSSVLLVSNKVDKVFVYRVHYDKDDNYDFEEIT